MNEQESMNPYAGVLHERRCVFVPVSKENAEFFVTLGWTVLYPKPNCFPLVVYWPFPEIPEPQAIQDGLDAVNEHLAK